MRYILIIARNLLTRAYLGAELKEVGFEVIGAEDIIGAVLQLKERGTKPDFIIMETREQNLGQEAIDLLSGLCQGTPILLICGTWDYPLPLKWQAQTYELTKPVTIGEIVAKVKEWFLTRQS